jgi:ubiquinone biosynthesis accessory factor UbiJ
LIKPLITRFLQHICSQNEWSRRHLQPFADKVVAFDFVLAKANLLILEDGSLALGGETHTPEATIHVSPSLALRLFAKDEAAKMFIKIDGDTQLATELSKVLQLMRWDIEEDLSKIVGDIAAFKIGEVSKKTFAEMKQQSINAAEMLSEYWQEEKNILAKKRHVEQFNAKVDTLKSDVARLEKRLQKLDKSLQKSSTA